MPVHPSFDPSHLYFVITTAEKHAHIFKRESMIRILNELHSFEPMAGTLESCIHT